MKSTHYKEGYRAYLAGVSRFMQNVYPYWTDEHKNWELGWVQAERDGGRK